MGKTSVFYVSKYEVYMHQKHFRLLVSCTYGQCVSRLDRLLFRCQNPCHNQLSYHKKIFLNIAISAA
jgi:hypothetical protein